MTFRRVVSKGEKSEEFKKHLENYIKKYTDPEIKIKISNSPFKENTLIIDLLGKGSMNMAEKFKNMGKPYGMESVIKINKPFFPKTS